MAQAELITRQPNFRRSLLVQDLIGRLAKLEIGQSVPLKELADLIGVANVDDGKFRQQLKSARDACRKEYRMVTRFVTPRVLTRLDDAGIVATGADAVRAIRRRAVKGLKELGCVEYGKLSNEQKSRHDAAAGHLGVLGEFSRPKAVEKIAEVTAKKQDKLTFAETLEAFKK